MYKRFELPLQPFTRMTASSSTSITTLPDKWIVSLPQFRKGVSLYNYQAESLEWIIKAEEKNAYCNVNGHIPLTEPFGSGKTFIILALIIHSPIASNSRVYLYNDITHTPYVSFALSHTNQLIRPTAIVVARSVYAQWVKNIETYTTLRHFEARDKLTTIKLISMIMNGDINDYDIVLIKYGQTQDEDSRVELCKLINQKTIPLIWSRVVYDDIDLIAESACMRAISSIFVTGATDFTYNKSRRSDGGAINTCNKRKTFDMTNLLVDIPPVFHVFGNEADHGSRNEHLWATLGHCPDTIARNHGIYAMRWLSCSIANSEIHRATNLIQGIEAVDCTELLEMINGDALISAAKLLHINAASPGALFASVLGTQKEAYETATARIEIIEKLREYRLSQNSDDNTNEREEILEQIDAPNELVKRAEKVIRKIEGDFHIDNIIGLTCAELDDNLEKLLEYRNRLDRSFVRIKENISSQTCSICYSSLESNHVVIMRCCGFIVCSSCCSRASRFSKTNDNRIVGLCVQCRQPLDLTRDIIIVDSSEHADKLIQMIIDLKGHCDDCATTSSSPSPSSSSLPSSSAASAAQSQHIWNNKITTKTGYVTALIRNRIEGLTEHNSFSRAQSLTIASDTLQIRQKDVPEIRGVMNGTQMISPPDGERMFLICTSFDEAIEDIAVALMEDGIEFEVLNGSVREFADKLARFTSREVRVLIINVRALYAGVDLQCATDIVLVSRSDIANLGQIIGRAQRLGRTCSLTVHMLEYVSNRAKHESNGIARHQGKHSKTRRT